MNREESPPRRVDPVCPTAASGSPCYEHAKPVPSYSPSGGPEVGGGTEKGLETPHLGWLRRFPGETDRQGAGWSRSWRIYGGEGSSSLSINAGRNAR